MGLCISYGGSLDDPSRLSELISDVRRFCRDLGWTVEDYSEHLSGIFIGNWDGDSEPATEPWPEEKPNAGLQFRIPKNRDPKPVKETLHGVIVCPPGTDAVALRFNSRGALCNYLSVPESIVIRAVAGETHYFGFPVSTKTTGHVESHVGICALLKMMSKYMSNLEVGDEGGFWETWDVTELRKRHSGMSAMIDKFSDLKTFNRILKAAGLTEVVKMISLDEPPAATQGPAASGRQPRRKKRLRKRAHCKARRS